MIQDKALVLFMSFCLNFRHLVLCHQLYSISALLCQFIMSLMNTSKVSKEHSITNNKRVQVSNFEDDNQRLDIDEYTGKFEDITDDEDEVDDDLYGDLETSIFHTTRDSNVKTRAELEKRVEELENLLEKANSTLKELTSKNKKLEKGHKTVLDNSLVLLETARSEIERKNFIITQLQRKYEDLSKKIRPQWNNDTDSPILTRDDIKIMVDKIRQATSESTISRIKQTDLIQAISDVNRVRLKEKESSSTSTSRRNKCRKIQVDKTTIYVMSEQCDFTRKEEVIFPKAADAESNQSRKRSRHKL